MNKVYLWLDKSIKRVERKARKRMLNDVLDVIARDFVICEVCNDCVSPVEVMRHLKNALGENK